MNEHEPYVTSYRVILTIGRQNTHVSLVKVIDQRDARILARYKGIEIPLSKDDYAELDEATYLWLALSAVIERLDRPRRGTRRPPRGATGGQGVAELPGQLRLDLPE